MEIMAKNLEYRYSPGTPFEKLAIHHLSLRIPENSYTAVIGHTGSGKSTLLQHLNGLLQPTAGEIRIGNTTIQAGMKEKHLRHVRKKVGIVFQFPEHQLFEENVEKDICFGPMNFGATLEEARKKAREAARLVGLPESMMERSPFDLSGGQMRRVAIACILAMEPEVLVLDEPTAGLDPRGRHEIMEMFARLRKEKGISIVLVTHNMEDASKYADRIVVMHNGTIYKEGTPREIFASPEDLFRLGLDVPEPVRFQRKLEEKLQQSIGEPSLSIDELADRIAAFLTRGNAR
jgi:ABC transporter./Cobalt ATP-binding cassette C terminal.